MREIVEKLQGLGKIYKSFEQIDLKALKIRNKIEIYKAIDTRRYYTAVYVIAQKSRILIKDVEKFEGIHQKLTLFCQQDFKHRYLFIDAPLCSKAKASFLENGWKVIVSEV